MLLRREFTVNGSRGSSGLCSTFANMSSVHGVASPSLNGRHQAPEPKKKKWIWNTTRGTVSQSSPAAGAWEPTSPGDFFVGNLPLVEGLQLMNKTAGNASDSAKPRLPAVKSRVPVAPEALLPTMMRRVRSSSEPSTKDITGPVSPIRRCSRFESSASTGTTSSAADAVAKHFPSDPTLFAKKGLATVQRALGVWPMEQENHRKSTQVQKSLDELMDAICYAANHTVSHSRRTSLQLCELEIRNSGSILRDAAYNVRVFTRWREEWDSPEQRHDYPYLSQRLRILRQLCKKHQREVEVQFKISWRPMYHEHQTLQRYRTLHGLKTKGEKEYFYHKLMVPLSSSHRSIQGNWLLMANLDNNKISHSLKQFLKTFSRIYHYTQELLEGWILLPSGRCYRRFEPISPNLRQSIGFFRVSIAELSVCLEWLSRKLSGVYRRPTIKEAQEIRAIVESYGRLHEPALPPLHPDGSSPVYLPVKGREGDNFSAGPVKPLQQMPWPKTPYFQFSIPLANSRKAMNASKPKAAAFHTSAAVRTADVHALRETKELLEEEPEQVGRGNETFESLSGGPLGYHIPSARMQESILGARSTRSAYWQYTLYEGPIGERVKVHYCKSLETMERISKLFLNESMIGFDIEWKPQAAAKDGIRKNVAMIQLASEERIALFHVARFAKGDSIEDLVAPTFRHIMESNSITKVGVSVKSDCTRLRNFLKIDSHGLFELSHLYKLVKYATGNVKLINKKLVSLAQQVEENLMLPMYKDQNVRSSDWSEDLNYEQIYYAASDSYAGFQLYHVLNHRRLSLFPTPPLPAHANLNLPIRLANGQTVAEYEDPSAEEAPSEPADSPLSSTDQLADDVMNLHIEDDATPSEQPPNLPNTKSSSTSLSFHPSIIAANEWIIRYRASTAPSTVSSIDLSYPLLHSTNPASSAPASTVAHSPSTPTSSTTSTPFQSRSRATPALLRAYFLFHHHQLTISDIASLLRSPPLQHSTVAGYVLEATRLEVLEIERGRVEECLKHVGEVGRGRYRGLVKRLGA